ncbi:MAG TPA: patatin-like phospholipase family protein [Tenuifilaceae bacterium]|nr:patatin-like phospholipase family protein [Tenuifilaceae bacterium]HPE18212.1 patatin-like phospholipase family protein [Tenuifilaceae bacterium]HPJ45495.1 patatin-like phospholipase family protein [Tenuifilaceae bacterium]HPQ33902.1 patatin-like phospholipase family protein [Tenuifilaceae bacterium]HRX68637.1 patatin-like phospholipase family protein [Tenuifilaceae bacterium]
MSTKIALALSSGGSRGLAHIGAIEEITQRGYEIVAISGSSIGAFVAGLYACKTMEKYKEWVLDLDKLDVFNLIDFTFSSHGFIKGEKVFAEMKKLGFIPEIKIENLKIPISIIASDIIRNEEVVFTSGNLYNALRASVSIPNVLTPIKVKNGLLVDGGVLNPLPINRIPECNADLVIAIDINALIPYKKPALPKKPKHLKEKEHSTVEHLKEKWIKLFGEEGGNKKDEKKDLGYFEIFSHTIQVMQDKITQFTIDTNPPDITVRISKDASGTFDFFKAEELIAAGKEACKNALDGAGL